jgi:cold shock protein
MFPLLRLSEICGTIRHRLGSIYDSSKNSLDISRRIILVGNTMETGTVKTVTDRGFGFISQENAEKDIFFHENSLEGELATRKLKVGDKVTFDVEQTPKGPSAVHIKLVE